MYNSTFSCFSFRPCTGLLNNKLSLYSALSHVTLHIQHSNITSYNFIPSLSWSTSPLMSFYYNLSTLLYLSPCVLLLQSPYTSLPLPLCPSTTTSLHFFTSPPVSFYYNLPTLLYLSPCVLLLQSPYTSLPLPLCPSTTISLHFFTQLLLSILSTCPCFGYVE